MRSIRRRLRVRRSQPRQQDRPEAFAWMMRG
jgi:hypothetical protein